MTTVDQTTGERTGKEPLATLTKLRKDISRKPIFGQNFLHETYGKEIERGMSVSVIS